MKRIIIILLLTISTPSWSFDYSALKGQWAVYHDSLVSSDDYYFLNINSDYSGVLIRSLGHEPIIREFTENDTIKRNGYIEIQLTKNEKAVLSAWKLKSGSGRLNGLIFMYKDNGELFNTLYYPLQLLQTGNELLNYETINKLSQEYR